MSVFFIDDNMFPIPGLVIPCLKCGEVDTVLEIDTKQNDGILVLQTCSTCEKTYELSFVGEEECGD